MTDSWHRGDWMQTNSGLRYYPQDPRSVDINPDDIAHALGMLCRYGGHVDRFYSVAEHCVLMSYFVPPQFALWALLHDATEAYCVDVPRPVKRYLTDYADIENRVWGAIALRFGLISEGDLIPALPAEVKEADNRILLDERTALMKNAEVGAWAMDGMEPLGCHIFGWNPTTAARMYRLRLDTLLAAR